MQSKINNDKNSKNNIIYNEQEKPGRNELLLMNKEIINSLILENTQKKDKSFISIKELEIIKEYESNLMKLLEQCPPKILKSIIDETSLLENLEDQLMDNGDEE